MKKFIRGALVIGAVAALGLSGCSANPKTALSVDGKSYSVADVTRVSQQAGEMVGGPTDPAKIVGILAYSGAVEKVSKLLPQPATEEGVLKELKTLQEQGKLRQTTKPLDKNTIVFWKTLLVLQAIQNPTVKAGPQFKHALEHSRIVINPLYGKLDANGQITAANPRNVIFPTPQMPAGQ
ncbi:MAG: hypothetical protein Q4A71_02705 [Actinomycetaceae bacterium]|nr:hypothetical protein [Actinomycetaceae bacterium]